MDSYGRHEGKNSQRSGVPRCAAICQLSMLFVHSAYRETRAPALHITDTVESPPLFCDSEAEILLLGDDLCGFSQVTYDIIVTSDTDPTALDRIR